MNKIKTTICFVGFIALAMGCSHRPSISLLCERDKKGNYLLKWEIYPETKDQPIEIYMSDNDSVFPSSPTITGYSNDYIAMISDTTQALERKYFKLKVGGSFSNVVSNRFFPFSNVLNFRDVGGYVTEDNRQVRWGKIFRSGGLGRMTSNDYREFAKLKIKTIIDIQPDDMNDFHVSNLASSYLRIPMSTDSYKTISQEIVDGRFLKGDAVIYSQDIYRDITQNYVYELTLFFDYLVDEKNYPIVYNCSLGKDQSGIATYLLLRALNVSSEIAEDDYMKSNEGIDRSKLMDGAGDLSESMQEALTMLTQTDMAILKYGISCMKNKGGGSVDEYMTKELNLTVEKRKKLKEILLY